MLRTLDHDLLANIPKRVRDRARWYVATEHVAHVLPSRSVSCDVSKVSTRYIVRLTIDIAEQKLAFQFLSSINSA